MKEKLEDISAKLVLVAKELGLLPDSLRRNKLIKELKVLAEDIHNYKVESLQNQRKHS